MTDLNDTQPIYLEPAVVKLRHEDGRETVISNNVHTVYTLCCNGWHVAGDDEEPTQPYEPETRFVWVRYSETGNVFRTTLTLARRFVACGWRIIKKEF